MMNKAVRFLTSSMRNYYIKISQDQRGKVDYTVPLYDGWHKSSPVKTIFLLTWFANYKTGAGTGIFFMYEQTADDWYIYNRVSDNEKHLGVSRATQPSYK